MAIAAGALACAATVFAHPIGPGTSPRHSSLATTARHAGHAARGRCPRGRVLLALHGPGRVLAGRPEAFLVLAHACTHVPAPYRVTVRGPQRISWVVRRARANTTSKKPIKLKFARVAAPQSAVTVTIEARSRRGRLLGRVHVRLTLESPSGALPAGSGTVGWGVNFRGEAGAGYRTGPLTHPVQGPLRNVRQIAAGFNSGFALLTDGTVRAWGANGAGQLGDGNRIESPTPVRVLGLSHVVQVAASGNHVLALLENGTVMVWGANYWGNLGNGTRDSVEGIAHPFPQPVPGLSGVVAIGAGAADDLAILANGTVLAWGEDKNGQLGDGATATKLVPTPVKNLVGVRSVVIGGMPSLGGHMLALLNDGRVMVAGQNEHGQLGLGDTEDRHIPVLLPGVENVASVSASVTHSLVTLADGTVLSWGTDTDGELGYPAPQMCVKQVCAKTPHRVPVPSTSAVSAGYRFSVAISGGRVLSWGNNEDGQLGDGTTTSSTAPVEVAGIGGIKTIAAGEKFTLGLAELGPVPDFFLHPGPGELIAEWTPEPGSEPWLVSWHLVTKPASPWGAPVTLPATAHSYVITGLSKALYEVRLVRGNNPSFGRRIALATPE